MTEQQAMASSLREKDRIDYKVLNDSGQVKLKPSNLQSIHSERSTSMENNKIIVEYHAPLLNSDESGVEITEVSKQLKELKLSKSNSNKINQQETDMVPDSKQLKIKYDILKDEIEDYIDENPTNDSVVSIDDIESCIDKITNLRTQFRQTVKNIQVIVDEEHFNSVFTDEITAIYAYIKEYIINAKDLKLQIRMQEKEISDTNISIKLKKNSEENSQRKRATDFLINEVTRISNELLAEFEKECDGEVTDDEISRRKEDLPSNLLKMEQRQPNSKNALRRFQTTTRIKKFISI